MASLRAHAFNNNYMSHRSALTLFMLRSLTVAAPRSLRLSLRLRCCFAANAQISFSLRSALSRPPPLETLHVIW